VLVASIIIILMLETASTSETLVHFYQATWHNIITATFIPAATRTRNPTFSTFFPEE
jgi:hypothetical protein